MSRRVVPTAVLGVAGGLLFAAQACSSISTSPGSHDAGRADVVQSDSANEPIDGGPDGSLGVLAVVDVPDSPCMPKGGLSTELYSTAQDPPGLDRLSRVGTRRVAEGSGQNGFFTFDLDGGNAGDAATSLAGLYNVSASEGATIGMIASDGTTLSYQRYDAQGATVGPVLALGTGALTGVTFAGGGGAALAVWGTGGAVWARGIGTAGTLAGPAFTIDARAFKNDLTVAAAYDGTSSFAMVWSGDAVGSRYRMRFGIASPTGIAGMRDITLTGTYNEITRLVKTPQGYALLLGVSDVGRTPVPYLLLLGNDGAPSGPARRLLGTLAGFGLAAQGNEIGVVAWRSTKEIEFRPFDQDANPLGPWVCMDAPSLGLSATAGVDADNAGYAVVYYTSTRAEALVRFDHLGTGLQ